MRFFLNLQQMTTLRGFNVDIKILDLLSCLPLPKGYILLLFLNNHWFQHILSTQVSDTGPVVLWFFNRLVFRQSTHVWSYYLWTRASVHLICSCTCTCIWKEDTCISKRSILFFFSLCSIWTLLEHLNIKSLHMHVQYRYLHTNRVLAPVAQSVECPLRENLRSRVRSRVATYQSL